MTARNPGAGVRGFLVIGSSWSNDVAVLHSMIGANQLRPRNLPVRWIRSEKVDAFRYEIVVKWSKGLGSQGLRHVRNRRRDPVKSLFGFQLKTIESGERKRGHEKTQAPECVGFGDRFILVERCERASLDDWHRSI